MLADRSIICFGGEDWWYHHPHSKAHLMRKFAQAGNRVIFVNSISMGLPGLAHKDLLPRINAFKFIISKHNPLYANVSDVGQRKAGTPVYVQPMDEYDDRKNAENLALALELATRHGYRLSLQIHKLLGIE